MKMTLEKWTTVDRYISDMLVPGDSALDAALDASKAAGLPSISVAPNQGKLLYLLARLCGARNILEIGTLGAYSTIWLARALPAGGRLVTVEADPAHAKVASANLKRAGLTDIVEMRVGLALDVLPALAAERRGPFDLVFIDADKPNTVAYFDRTIEMTRPGSLIVVDNVIREGAIADAATKDASVQGMRRFFERLRSEPRVEATALQTVGSKGYDGLAIALVK
jgi:predicted O-methyltransferase YrrM